MKVKRRGTTTGAASRNNHCRNEFPLSMTKEWEGWGEGEWTVPSKQTR